MPFAGMFDLRRFNLPSSGTDPAGICFDVAPARELHGDGLRIVAEGGSSLCHDRGLIILADARIDNQADLEAIVGIPSSSPAQPVLQLWRRFGARTLDELLGDYALLVVDLAARRLLLARDPTGQRPLFYARRGHQLAVASTPRLLARFGIALRPDLASLARRLQERENDPEDSGFLGVQRCLPGHVVEIDLGGERSRRWWWPAASPQPFDPGRDYAAEYRQLLEQAVACRTESGLVATHLSAGWDSSAVTAAATKVVGVERVVAFTAAPRGQVEVVDRHALADETGVARETVEYLGITHQPVRPSDDPFKVAEEVIRQACVPVSNPFQLAWWRAIQGAARQAGADSLLTGELGNLGLNASGLNILPLLASRGEWMRWWHEVRASTAAGSIRWRGALAASFGGRLPRPLLVRLDRRFGGGMLAERVDFLRREWREELGSSLPADPYEARRALISWNDSGSMRELAARQFGLAESDPTSDRRILEWSLTLPVEAFLHEGVLRPMARAALGPMVAPAVLENRRRGMQAADWYRQVSAARCLKVLERIADVAAVRELLDLDEMRSAIRTWPSGGLNSAQNYSRYRVGLVGALCIGLFAAEFS